MRNAIEIAHNLILTIDNAACLGEKEADVVTCANEVVSYFTTRTALFEQLCAGALPDVLTLANFTGDSAWDAYMKGIAQAFNEIGLELPKIVGSTESNFQSLQSAFSISLIGKRHIPVTIDCPYWYVVGVPLVGNAVLLNKEKCAPLGWLYEQLKSGVISYLHPVGSSGLQKEFKRLFKTEATVSLTTDISSGPATAVIVGSQYSELKGFPFIEKIHFKS